jgi:hypothetical protein
VINLHAPFEPAPFEIVLRGFNRQQVLDRIGSLQARVAALESHAGRAAAERDAALRQNADLAKVLEHLRREAHEATSRVERLQRSSLGGAGVRIQHMLQVAEDELAALQISTEQETTALRESTRAQADQLLRETTQRCELLERESAQRRSTAEAESAARCRQAEQESERRRRSAEQKSEADIARREGEWSARIRETHTRGLAGLHLLLRVSGERLTRRVAEAEGEVRRFAELRTDVTARLSSAHRALAEAIGQACQNTASEQAELSASHSARSE